MSEVYRFAAEVAADLPCLTLEREGVSRDAPLVLAIHGLGRHKETMLPTLYAFAQRGLRAIALDVRLHGERPNAASLDDRLEQDYLGTMAEMIQGTVQDLSRLLDALEVSQAAIHGVSLGGYITFAALADEPRFTVGSVAIGSPDWLEPLRALGLGPGVPVYDALAARSPLERAAKLYPPRPLLMQHGEQDERVSLSGVLALMQRLTPLYRAFPERLELVRYPGVGHVYTDEMMLLAADWAAQYAAH